jgi:hypothetical protein
MAKDKRLYMTFPNDFWMHPKIAPLTVEAKWAFVEMNGYSRMQDLDGRIPAVMMHRMWASEVVAELCASHADRPLMFHDDAADEYVIRDYAAHQQTTADREEMSAKRSVSGKLGASKRWNGKPIASAMANEWQTDGKGMAETETETELETKKIKTLVYDASDLFPDFWNLWPRSDGKLAASKAWAKAIDKIDGSALLELVRNYVNHPNRPALEFIPHAATWLNGERWNDGPPVARSSTVKPTQSDRFHETLQMGRELQAELDRAADMRAIA